MFLSGCVVANDPRTALHHFIIINAYLVCLATESMNEIYVNNFKDEIVRKKKTPTTFKYISKYNTIYKDHYSYHKCN
jgi:hypothetical protein